MFVCLITSRWIFIGERQYPTREWMFIYIFFSIDKMYYLWIFYSIVGFWFPTIILSLKYCYLVFNKSNDSYMYLYCRGVFAKSNDSTISNSINTVLVYIFFLFSLSVLAWVRYNLLTNQTNPRNFFPNPFVFLFTFSPVKRTDLQFLWKDFSVWVVLSEFWDWSCHFPS